MPYPLSHTSLQIRILDLTRLRRSFCQYSAVLALSPLLTIPERIYSLLDLCAQIRAMEGRLIHYLVTIRAIPAQTIHGGLWPVLFQHDAHGVGKPYGIVGRVGRQQEHLAFADDDVSELALVDNFQSHGALILVEPFSGLVDVVIGARVRTSYYLPDVRMPLPKPKPAIASVDKIRKDPP